MNRKLFYLGMLLVVTFFWGVTFPVIKISLEYMNPVVFLILRFSISSLVMLPLIARSRSLRQRNDIIRGFSAGFLLFLGYFLQTAGLQYTSSSQSGIITGIYVVLLPLVSYVYLRKFPARVEVVASFLAFGGLIIMSAGSIANPSYFLGDMLTIISAVAYTFQIAYVSKYSAGLDTGVFTFYQLLSVALFSSLFLPFYLSGVSVNGFVIFTLFFTAILAGVLAIFITNRSLAYVEPTAAGVIFVGEPVFAAMASVIIIGTPLGIYTLIGGSIMVLAMFITSFGGYLRDLSRRKALPQAQR